MIDSGPYAGTTETPGDNVDQREIDQFARQSADWWNPNGAFRPLHQIGPARLQFIRDTALRHFATARPGVRPLRDLTCLDIGCGGGLISEPLARMGGHVSAIDPAPENIAAARHHAEAGGLEIAYRACTAETLVAESRHFDLVVCLEVIEHVPQPDQFVATVAKLVRPGGLLIMSTINRTPQAYALAIIGAEYILRWLPAGTHQWDKFVRPSELKRSMEAAGLGEVSTKGLVYDILKDSWSLSDNTDVNYLASAIRPAAAA